MKRIVSLILCLALTLLLFAGCDNKGTESNDTSAPEEEIVLSKEDISYLDGQKTAHTIVWPAESDYDVKELATTLAASMKKTLVFPMKSNEDSKAEKELEILIGDTVRPESALAKQYLINKAGKYAKNYAILSIGKKIAIVGMSKDALSAAIDRFADEFVKTEGTAGGIECIFKDETVFEKRTIAGASISDFSIVRQHFNLSYITQREIEKMQSVITEKFGFFLPVNEDAYKEAGDFEIVIGDTNRSSEKPANRDEYSIRLEGKRVYINGGHNYSTAIAVSEFVKVLEKGDIADGFTLTGSYAETVKDYDGGTTFVPTWYDDFDGNALDTDKWIIINNENSGNDAYGGKKSVRTDNPSVLFVRDGLFNIKPFEDENKYYGGKLTTNGTMSYKYGFIEISEKMPNAPGFWTSLWTGSNDLEKYLSPEIDICESFGNGSIAAANCHAWPSTKAKNDGLVHTSLDSKYGSKKRATCPDGKTFNDGFHTFGLFWDATQMSFTCDGKIYFSYDITTTQNDIEAFANHSMYLILSMAVGFANNSLDIRNATAEDWELRSDYQVDSVYLYQLKDGSQELKIVD